MLSSFLSTADFGVFRLKTKDRGTFFNLIFLLATNNYLQSKLTFCSLRATLGVSMEVKERDIEIYKQADGKKPYEEWLGGIKDGTSRARIRARIDKVATGNFGDFKSVGDGVSELRFTFGPGYRVYYGLDGEKIVLLLFGGDKSTQDKDIEKAKEYWKDYKERTNE